MARSVRSGGPYIGARAKAQARRAEANRQRRHLFQSHPMEDEMELDPDTACALALKLNRFHGKARAGPDVVSSNAGDDGMDEALVAGRDAGVEAEIEGLIEGLSADARAELAGLVLIAREADAYESLEDAAEDARGGAAANLYEFLMEQPEAGSLLADGLERAGLLCDGLAGAERPTS